MDVATDQPTGQQALGGCIGSRDGKKYLVTYQSETRHIGLTTQTEEWERYVSRRAQGSGTQYRPDIGQRRLMHGT